MIADNLLSAILFLGVVVNGGSIGRPLGGVVGLLNGASGVPIGPRHVLTAKHVNPQPTQLFYIRDGNQASGGFARYVSKVYKHPTADLSIVELATTNGPLPYYARVSSQVPVAGRPVRIGGWGYYAGVPLSNGYLWQINSAGAYDLQENWGLNSNATSSSSTNLSVTYSAGLYNSVAARQDSGGGIFVQYGGVWELAGIITTATSGTTQPGTVYGAYASAIRIKNYIPWIQSIVPPSPDSICYADANGDFKTNSQDLSVILANFGRPVLSFSGGDFDGDGFVNGSDLTVYLSNFGCGE